MKTFVIAFTAFVFFISAPAFSKEGVLDIQEVTSENGITAWLVTDITVPVISMEVGFYGVGTAYDPEDKQGLARLASNTMDEGAGSIRAKEFQKELRDLSLTLHFNAKRDSFGASLKTLTKNKERAFELLKLALQEPRFDQEAIERMKKANQSRIRASQSDPSWMAARILNDKAFEGHPYAMNSGGTISGLERIKSKDLKDFHKNHIGKNNLHIAVAGDISAEELKPILDDVFSGLPEIEINDLEELEIQNSGQTFFYAQDIPQTVIEIMQPGISRADPDYISAQVMNFILGSSGFGSRLTEEIREKRGLTYGIYSYLYTLGHANALAVSTSTATQNAEEMLSLIQTEFTKIKNEPVSAQELADAKAYLIGSVPLSLTSTDKIAALLLSLQLDKLPINYLDQREETIQNTDIQTIQEIAQKLLKPEQLTVVMVGKPSSLENDSEIETVKDLPNVE